MGKPRILVCEDEESVRAAIRLVLERDYELSFAEDGEQALTQVTSHPVELILLDIKLPKVDGLEILKTAMAQSPAPRVLMLTAYQSAELAQRAIQAGALDYVTKPFTREQLLRAVERALMLQDWQRPGANARSAPDA